MAIPVSLQGRLALPVVAAPMFIVSNPDLVIAQCKGGLIGSFPALNARPKELLDAWLIRIKAELADDPKAAPMLKQNGELLGLSVQAADQFIRREVATWGSRVQAANIQIE